MLKDQTSKVSTLIIIAALLFSCGSKEGSVAGTYQKISKTDMSNDEVYTFPIDSRHSQIGYEVFKIDKKWMVKFKDLTDDNTNKTILENKEAFEINRTDDGIYQRRVESEYGEVTVYTFVFSEEGVKIEEYAKNIDKGGFDHQSTVRYDRI